MNLSDKLKRTLPGGLSLCVGLDPVMEKLPESIRRADEPYFDFCKEIIDATADYAAAYKPNCAFFEALGAAGWDQLAKTISVIPENKLIIADAKRGDIGNTAKAYARALFSTLKVDMATVSPYLGSDSLQPFVEDAEHGIFVLTVTSNPGGSDLQTLDCEGQPLYMQVAKMAKLINKNGNVGMVVGATKPEMLPPILKIAEDMPLLIPGIGAQGGDVQKLKDALKGYSAPAFVNSSRGIIYASSGADFASAARGAAGKLYDLLK